MRIFAEGDLRGFLDQRRQQMKQEVHGQSDNYLLNANETQYVEYLADKYTLDPLVIRWDELSASDREEMIPAEHFPSFRFNVEHGRSYSKQVITYHLPYSGDDQLLRLTPSTRILWSTDVSLRDGCICFDIVNFYDTPEEIKREADELIKSIRTQTANVEKEVEQFNRQIPSEATQAVAGRKADLLKKSSVLGSLGVPFKKNENVSSTFAVPAIKKRVAIKKPTASTAPFTPEPTLDSETYDNILQIIWDAGVEMERHPSIYRDKDEETLRDHLLMVLAPHFDSTTGETFNKAGKTDILIRHEKHNLFIAECKFWSGIKGFHKTVDQLLGYLTWRDSKAAVVVFVKNKEIAPVLETIEQHATDHPTFVKFHGSQQEGWFNYEFHLPDDESRAVSVAVLAFHFP